MLIDPTKELVMDCHATSNVCPFNWQPITFDILFKPLLSSKRISTSHSKNGAGLFVLRGLHLMWCLVQIVERINYVFRIILKPTHLKTQHLPLRLVILES